MIYLSIASKAVDIALAVVLVMLLLWFNLRRILNFKVINK